MWNKWKVFPLLAMVLLLSAPAFADELFSLKGGYQLLSREGSIAGTSGGDRQKLDLEKDLNLDDSEGITAEVALRWGNSHLSFNYLPISFSGTGTLTASAIIDETTYSTSDTVKTDLDIDLYDIGYTYYLFNFDDTPARFQLGLELAVKVADIDVTLNNLDTNSIQSESVTAPVPTIGIRTRIALADFIGISGRIGYMELYDNSFLDAEAQIEFSPIPLVGIYAGVRYFDLQIDEGHILLDTKFSGPFAGVLVRF